jgi:hypothetical protein
MKSFSKSAMASVVLLAVAFSTPLHATRPPPAPAQYAAYGPFQLCSNKFVIAIGKDEAVHIVGDIVRIINDQEILSIKFANDRYWFTKAEGSLRPPSKSPFLARRFYDPVPDAGNTVPYAPHGLQKEDIRYAMIPESGGDLLFVGATSFDNSDMDDRLLDRIRPGSEQTTDCLSLWHAISNTTDGEMGKRVGLNKSDQANMYPPAPDNGPVFYCVAGIGFELKADETLLRPWRSLGYNNPVYVNTNETSIRFEARSGLVQRIDPENLREHPVGILHKSEITYYPSRGVGPPYAAEGVREDGSWNVALDVLGLSKAVEISFPASEKTGAGFNFLERLEIVNAKDPRCGTTGSGQ